MLSESRVQIQEHVKDTVSAGRRRHSTAYKCKVALEAARGDKTLSQLAEQYQLHPGQISMAAFELSGKIILPGSFGSSPISRMLQGFQHGSGSAVHCASLRRTTGSCRYPCHGRRPWLRHRARSGAGLRRCLTFYNDERPHQSLDYAVPAAVHSAVKEQSFGTC
jgi:hypothetical protein